MPKAAETVCRQRSAGWLPSNSPAGAQHVAGDCQLVSGRAEVVAGILQHKVFEVDELAVDPKRGAGVICH